MDMDQTNEIFMFKEPMVLLPILCLSLLKGIANTVDQTRFFAHTNTTGNVLNSFTYYEIIRVLAPLPGLILITFISEIKGRKIVFFLLFALCVLSSILSYIPYQRPWAIMENYINATLRAGASSMITVAICEYCRPKHRFAYLVANVAIIYVGTRILSMLYNADIISKESSYLAICELIVALVCLGSVYWWPESPYWLAGQGRYEDCRNALMQLRKEEGDRHKELHAIENSRRRSTPKLFWLTLFVAFLTITLARCASAGQMFLTIRLNEKVIDLIAPLSYRIITTCVSSVVSFLIVLVSYKVPRKVIYLSTTLISIALLYVMSIWAYIRPYGHDNFIDAEQEHKPVIFYIILFICNILLECGPYILSLALLIEFIPQKYNTYISCVSYVYFFASDYFFSFLPINYRGSFPTYGFMFLFATLAFVAILILYCLIPETRGKNLLQIEKLCLSGAYGENAEQRQIVLEEISKFNAITSAISQSPVSVIVGAAGCGKSTRAPLAVLRSNHNAATIVSGPRRVAAVGLARRVASELGEQVGETVGYQVRLDSKPPRPPAGSILYCTSGVLLRRLQTNPGLHGCTHVFIDEAHERDVNTDITLLLLKRAVELNPDLRVVVMSATLDTEVFTKYFNSCPVVEVPGRTFPVETLYLDDIKQKYSLKLPGTFENCKREDGRPQVNCQEIVEVVKAVDRTEGEGAILDFLPGWAEIKQAKILLDQCYEESTHLVLPVHSRLSTTDQARMFSKPLPGVRKIVLATNIAETSITIPDVVYVVDSGAHKENRVKEGRGTVSLETVWVSGAGARQRAGRAGRVQPGWKSYSEVAQSDPPFKLLALPFTSMNQLRHCENCTLEVRYEDMKHHLRYIVLKKKPAISYLEKPKLGHCFKLYTKEKENEFMPFSTPEILRVPLEQTVLDCKTYAPDDKVEDFLSQLPESPSSKAIQLAVNDLIDLGALSRTEHLTRLGSILSSFTLHPRLARGLLSAAVIGNCVAAANVVTHCADNVEVFANAADRKEEIREIKREFNATSDHAALHWIQEEFERVAGERGGRGLDAWCERYGLRKDRLGYVKSISNLYLQQLLKSPVVQPSPDAEELNRFSEIDELTSAVLLCGANALLSTRTKLRTKGKLMPEAKLVTSKGDRALIGSDSVNHGIKRNRTALLAYFGGFHSTDRRALVVHKTTRVSAQAVALLCQGDVSVGETYDDTTVLKLRRHKLSIHVPTSQVDHLLRVREMLSNTLNYYIERDPSAISYEENTTVARFKVRLVKALGRILVEAHRDLVEGKSIESKEIR